MRWGEEEVVSGRKRKRFGKRAYGKWSEGYLASLNPTSNPSIAASITCSENPSLTNRSRQFRITSKLFPDFLTSTKATSIRFPIASKAGRTVPGKSGKAKLATASLDRVRSHSS